MNKKWVFQKETITFATWKIVNVDVVINTWRVFRDTFKREVNSAIENQLLEIDQLTAYNP